MYLLPPQHGTDTTGTTAPPKSALQLLWEEQTLTGTAALTEKATAGFFSTGKGAGIYAFHNTAPRGAVMQVKNLNNDRTIYVKVLGPIPATKPFRGCTLALSNAAKVSLDVRDFKAYCEISYMGY